MKIIIKGFNAYQYSEVRKIIQWKDGFVWKTKPIGFIHQEDEAKWPKEEYVLCSISTKNLVKDGKVLDEVLLEPFLGE